MARSQIAAILGISVDRVQVTADYYFHDNTVARGTCTKAGPWAEDGQDPVWPSSEILKLKYPRGTPVTTQAGCECSPGAVLGTSTADCAGWDCSAYNECCDGTPFGSIGECNWEYCSVPAGWGEYNHAYEWVDDTDGHDCDTDSIDEDQPHQPCILPPDNGRVAAAACSLMDVAYGSADENACGHFTRLPTDSIDNPWMVRNWWLYKDSIEKDVTTDPGYGPPNSDANVDAPECWSRMPYTGAQKYGITTLVFVIGADASDLGADGFAEHLMRSTGIPTIQFNGESTLIWPAGDSSNGAYVGFPRASQYDHDGGYHVPHPLLGKAFEVQGTCNF